MMDQIEYNYFNWYDQTDSVLLLPIFLFWYLFELTTYLFEIPDKVLKLENAKQIFTLAIVLSGVFKLIYHKNF